MNHDVFISYSRKDREQAEALCNALAEAGVKYWIDLSIGGSTNFLTEITRRIKACKTLIFIASANSAASEFTQKEILYAIKHKKPILPYKIGDFQFEDNDELDFIFTNVQWVESLDAVVSALNDMGLTNKTTSEVVAPKHEPQPKPATKTYKVGDLYDDGTKRGVVFEVTPDGRHGKIVSLEETELPWAKDNQKVGTSDFGPWTNINMQAVYRIEGWREKYPAFAWCANLGEDWYLPTTTELRDLFEIKDVVNEELERQGAKKILGAPFVTWSSTENNATVAWGVTVRDGITLDYNDIKLNLHHVRAVAKF